MKDVTLPFASNLPPEAPQWLQEKVYEPKRLRTVSLVRQSVDTLLRENRRVSVSAIVKQSKMLDPEGRGVSNSAIHNNQEAYNYYQQHRSHKEFQARRTKESIVINKIFEINTNRTKPDRDVLRARQRYMRLSKDDLVERLLAVEQAFAEQEEQWHQQNDKLLSWWLKSEQTETQDLVHSIEAENLELKQQVQRTMNLLTMARAEVDALKEMRQIRLEDTGS